MRNTLILIVILLVAGIAGAVCTDPQSIPSDKEYLVAGAVTAIAIDKVETYEATAPVDLDEWAEFQLAKKIAGSSNPTGICLEIARKVQMARCGDGNDTNWSTLTFPQAVTALEPFIGLVARSHYIEAPQP